MFVPLDGFEARLTDTLWSSENMLSLAIDRETEYFLFDKLEEDDYTYLTMRNDSRIEVVKLENFCGRLYLWRGQEGTRPTSVACNDRIWFEMTKQGIEDLVCQMDDCEENPMTYVPLVGFVTIMLDEYLPEAEDLPIFEEHLVTLRDKLRFDGSYTYLMIQDHLKTEIVKVDVWDHNIRVQRGMEGTEPQTFPKGACIKWILTSGSVRDIVCQMDCCPNEDEEETS